MKKNNKKQQQQQKLRWTYGWGHLGWIRNDNQTKPKKIADSTLKTNGNEKLCEINP